MTTKPFVRFVDDDDNSILKDGETISVRMMMRDSITKSDAQIALDATQAVKIRDAAILDAAHRPGFIRAAPVMTDAAVARNNARGEIYDAYDRDLADAWRRKDATVTDATDSRTAYHDSVKEKYSRTDHYDAAKARAARDAAYAAYDSEQTDAWRNK
jgi:hypothetical protein